MTATCPNCQTSLAADAPAGLCPKCLLAAALQSEVRPAGYADITVPSPAQNTFEPPPVEQLAKLFPQLEILELIGKGGMGAVYKARQPGLDRFVAVKILPPEVGCDPAFAERFTREARALARLGHPHIVGVYDFGQTGGLFYFVMEFIDGANLRQTLQAGKLAPEQALAIVPQICDALQYAHDEGIVHRDIKPENILLDKRGRVKIADFGLSKLVHQADLPDVSLTGTHQIMGTLRYMAPEQMQGTKGVDHRADIYSLGVVFYELLTGETPMGHFDPPSKRVQVDVRLDEVVLRALAQEPDKRYQHASEVKTDVEQLAPRRQAAAAARPKSPQSAAPASIPSVSDEIEQARHEVRIPAIGLMIVGGLACAIAILPVCLGLLYFVIGSSHDEISVPQRSFSYALPDDDQRTQSSGHTPADLAGLPPVSPATIMVANALVGQQPAPMPAQPIWGLIVGPIVLALFVFLPAFPGIFLVFAGGRMLQLQSYGLCIAAAILAILPCQLLFPLGVLFGIWSLIVLNRPHVRRAFGEQQRLSSTARSSAGGTVQGGSALQVANVTTGIDSPTSFRQKDSATEPPGKPNELSALTWWEQAYVQWPSSVRMGVQIVLALIYAFGLICFFSFSGSRSFNDQVTKSVITVGQPGPWLESNVSDNGFRTSFNLFSSSVLIAIVAVIVLQVARRLEQAEKGKAHSMLWHYAIWSIMLSVIVGIVLIDQGVKKGGASTATPGNRQTHASYLADHQASAMAVAMLPDGETYVSAGADGKVIIRDKNRDIVGSFRIPLVDTEPQRAALFCLAVADNGQTIYAGGNTGVWRWGRTEGEPAKLVVPTQSAVRFLAICDQGRKLACITNTDIELALYELKSFQKVATSSIPPGVGLGNIVAAESSPEGRFIAISSSPLKSRNDNDSQEQTEPYQLTVYDTQQQAKEVLTWQFTDSFELTYSRFAFTAENSLLLYTPLGQVKRWQYVEKADAKQGGEWLAISTPDGVRITPGRFTSCAVSRDGSTVYLTLDRQISGFDTQTDAHVSLLDLDIGQRRGDYGSTPVVDLTTSKNRDEIVAALWDGCVVRATCESLASPRVQASRQSPADPPQKPNRLPKEGAPPAVESAAKGDPQPQRKSLREVAEQLGVEFKSWTDDAPFKTLQTQLEQDDSARKKAVAMLKEFGVTVADDATAEELLQKVKDLVSRLQEEPQQ